MLTSARSDGGGTIEGAPGDGVGGSVGSAGDVNADGRLDLLIGGTGAELGGPAPGSVYVVFGPQAPTDIDLGVLGGSGIRIDEASEDDDVGRSAAGGGT